MYIEDEAVVKENVGKRISGRGCRAEGRRGKR